ncbi:glycosyltransferase [Jiangella asiatica]|uniref:Glycosyltransferase n=1 Tax=Jiangella asiatica TaxID=2530372 RepID=A0A4R5DNW8_9ACTN|nr:glycosyltransferase [Jiangella asiatica]TDE15919.1 glycosyltransferase [Jiangella asiatica]
MANDRSAFVTQLGARLCGTTDPASLATTLLRTGSGQALDIVALTATSGRFGYDELLPKLAGGDDGSVTDPRWLPQLARIAALRRAAPDPTAALAILEQARQVHGTELLDGAARQLYAQLLVTLDPDRLPKVLDSLDLPPSLIRSIRADAANPFVTAGASVSEWTALLAAPFVSVGLEPVSLSGDAATPFDRLSAEASTAVDDTSLVSVVMSAYRPDASIFAAVRSILGQSWRNVELLVVDDASPEEFDSVLDEIAALDDRVRVLRSPANRGTYMARNLALEHARGEFVTFQDSDDWAHPRRLELQLAPLRDNPELLATRSHTLRAFPDLTFTYLGYPPDRINASSLLFRRREVVDLIGYFDTVRKSADVEYPERLRAAVPGSVLDLDPSLPLAICQLRAASLSRLDAIPGWMHWSRTLYRDAYRARNVRVRRGLASAYYDGNPDHRLLPLPDPSWSPTRGEGGTGGKKAAYDVVVLNDWRRGNRHPRSVLNDLHAMLDAGLRVAVAHAETFEPAPNLGRRPSLAGPILELVNDGTIAMTHVSQAASTRLLLTHDPATLQFAPDVDARLSADRVALLVDPETMRADGRTFRTADVVANSERLFSRRPTWVPRTGKARTTVAAASGPLELAELDLAKVYDPARLAAAVQRLRAHRPVIGRHVPDHASHWPATPDTLLAAYPDDDAFDVRIMGGVGTPLRVLGTGLPPNWVSFPDGALTVRTFLAQLDFFVYFDRDDAAVPGDAVIEAMSSGCVAVLPPHLQEVYGDGALYCEPGSVREVVTELHRSPSRYTRLQERARHAVAQRYGAPAFVRGLRRLLDA